MSNALDSWSATIPTEDGFYFIRLKEWSPEWGRLQRPDPVLVRVDDGSILAVKIGGVPCPEKAQPESDMAYEYESVFCRFAFAGGEGSKSGWKFGPEDCEFCGPFNPPA